MKRQLPHTPFRGRHPESGSICNALALQGVVAPHTQQPYSEAFIMGLSGGATFGYFLFDYKGHAPMLSLLSRNTFDPFETTLNRLNCARDVLQTSDSAKAERALRDAIEGGQPVIVWADMCTLPYNGLQDAAWWAMSPVVVYGIEGDRLLLADRSAVPLDVNMTTFSAARARIKKDRNRAMTISAPDVNKLPKSIRAALLQCVALYTQAPPKGARTNFGFAAYQQWADMLVNTRNSHAWSRFFSAGLGHWSALAGGGMSPGLIGWIETFGAGDGFERALYAEFLDEAASLLKQTALKRAADAFRAAHGAWKQLVRTAMPEDIALCREARELIVQKHAAFVCGGAHTMDERSRMDARLAELRQTATNADYAVAQGLTETRIVEIRAAMRADVQRIAAHERTAIDAIRAAL
jgi:hypothetical protein